MIAFMWCLVLFIVISGGGVFIYLKLYSLWIEVKSQREKAKKNWTN